MEPVFANQLEAFDYLNIDIMSRILTEEEKTAVEVMIGGIDTQQDNEEESQRDVPYDPFPPRPALTHAIHRERSLSPERYVTPPRAPVRSVRDGAVTREQRREAVLRSRAIAAIGRRGPDPTVVNVEDSEEVPSSTIAARAPGPLVLPQSSGNVPNLPPRTPMQSQVAPALLRRGIAYNDAILHNVDIGSLVSPYVIELDRDPRNLPAGIPSEHAAAWRRLVQIGIMISHYTQLVMTDCEVYIALEQVSRILTAYNGLGIRRLFQHLRGRTDIRATHIYDLHNGYKRFFIAAAAQLNQAHISPATRVSSGARVFTESQ